MNISHRYVHRYGTVYKFYHLDRWANDMLFRRNYIKQIDDRSESVYYVVQSCYQAKPVSQQRAISVAPTAQVRFLWHRLLAVVEVAILDQRISPWHVLPSAGGGPARAGSTASAFLLERGSTTLGIAGSTLFGPQWACAGRRLRWTAVARTSCRPLFLLIRRQHLVTEWTFF